MKKVLIVGANKKTYAVKRVIDEIKKKKAGYAFMKLNEFYVKDGKVFLKNGEVLNFNEYEAVYFRSPTYIINTKDNQLELEFNFFEEYNLLIGLFRKNGAYVFNGDVFLKYPYYDKFLQSYLFSENKIPTIMTIGFIDNKFEKIKETLESLGIGFPMIIKESNGGQGKGVFKVDEENELKEVLKNKRNLRLIYQKYEPNNCDYRVLVCGGKSVGIMRRIASDKGWKNNFSQGAEVESYKDEKMEKFCEDVCRKIGFKDYAGVDLFKTDKGYKVIEINMFPGFEGFEKAYPKINVAGKIVELLLLKNRQVNK